MTKETRRYQRNSFNPGTWVRLIADADVSYPRSFLIIDISIGGIGLISTNEEELKMNEKYFILDVDGITLPKKVKVEVVHVSPIAGPENRFRVGFEFLEVIEIKSK